MSGVDGVSASFSGDESSDKRAWTTPRLTELAIGGTQAGPSPNVQETVLTDTSLAS